MQASNMYKQISNKVEEEIESRFSHLEYKLYIIVMAA